VNALLFMTLFLNVFTATPALSMQGRLPRHLLKIESPQVSPPIRDADARNYCERIETLLLEIRGLDHNTSFLVAILFRSCYISPSIIG
jgi:hypothetical protein